MATARVPLLASGTCVRLLLRAPRVVRWELDGRERTRQLQRTDRTTKRSTPARGSLLAAPSRRAPTGSAGTRITAQRLSLSASVRAAATQARVVRTVLHEQTRE